VELTVTSRRYWLDALRGAAIVWMMAYHFNFDLNWYGMLLPAQDFYRDRFWIFQRNGIVALFLFCAGYSQSAALAQNLGWPRFWRRWLQIVGCAALVSIGSKLLFPESWISFGVLHAIAVMLILVRLCWPLGRMTWLLAAMALIAPIIWQHAFFDSRLTNWVGLVTHKPVTEDYVPILPWLGVMWIGALSGREMSMRRNAANIAAGTARIAPRAMAPLIYLGRHPLTVYMLHQPVFIAALWLCARIR
jgi:uncharacterized membrane protein